MYNENAKKCTALSQISDMTLYTESYAAGKRNMIYGISGGCFLQPPLMILI